MQELEIRELETSMVPPWGGAGAGGSEVEDVDAGPPRGCWRLGPTVATIKVEDVDGGPPKGCWRHGPTAATTEVEDVDGGPLGVLLSRSDSGHH